MKRRLDELSENASALGQAGLDLAKAEASALSRELKLSSRTFLRLLLLFASCLAILFWALAVLIFVGIEVGALWMPRWGSALVILGVLLLAAVVVGVISWRRLRRLETPMMTARRRLEDHLEWWHRRVVGRER